MAEKNGDGTSARGWSRIFVNIGTTIFLGAIGSGAWEIMFRPGISTFSTFLSSISGYFEDQIYATAALDPRPVPGLILLLLVCAVPLLVAVGILYFGFLFHPFRTFIKRRIEGRVASVESLEAKKRVLQGILKITSIAAFSVSLIFSVFILIGFSLQDEATLVWRVFSANIEIASATLPDRQIKLLRSEFRRMKTKADFKKIEDEMNDALKSSGPALDWYSM